MTSAICIVSMASCSVHKRNVLTERPQPEQIQAALDSICAEGYNLFVAERVNWVATDSALAHCDENNLRGNIIWQPNSGMWSAVFFDREQKNCLFELVYDTRTGEERCFYEPRPLSEQERAQWELKGTMFDNAIKSYGDSLRYNSDYGRPNVDFVAAPPPPPSPESSRASSAPMSSPSATTTASISTTRATPKPSAAITEVFFLCGRLTRKGRRWRLSTIPT